MKRDMIKGIAVNNPWDIDKDYLLFTIDYAAKMGFDHVQIVGPIHDVVRGNCDGMTPYRKYSQFNDEKDMPYVEHNLDAVNAACEKAAAYGIKTYMWHHELELPNNFREAYPETLNNYGDIEVTHPIIKDFLENKIIDFFYHYPKMDGLILTLHETKYPLLKLRNQKLDKIQRVKYVTQILFDTCKSLGKELIVRPFASIEEDYQMMLNAYEEISTDMLVMDKWTQFDWSLTMPHNQFFHKIKKNPLFVEADIFGEFFGKGHLPLMLKDHIAKKFEYCESFAPKGYVARIDRTFQTPFGGVNEVNNDIMRAHYYGEDPDAAIDAFMEAKYPGLGAEVKAIMEKTEEVLIKTIWLKGYYYSRLSLFPDMNHSKNHFYFEMMRKDCQIASNEWFIPKGWKPVDLDILMAEKDEAVAEAAALYDKICALKDRMDAEEYQKIWTKFCNLKYVTEIWRELTKLFINYVKFFETRDEQYKVALRKASDDIIALKLAGIDVLGDKFYCSGTREYFWQYLGSNVVDYFVNEIWESFELELKATERLEKEDLVDFIVCGGGMEGHKLQKEVNFSDVFAHNGVICRIPGDRRGAKWCSINAHGWFSYEVAVKPGTENTIIMEAEGFDGEIDAQVTIGDEVHEIHTKTDGIQEFKFTHTAAADETAVRIRVDKLSVNTPCVSVIKVLK